MNGSFENRGCEEVLFIAEMIIWGTGLIQFVLQHFVGLNFKVRYFQILQTAKE